MCHLHKGVDHNRTDDSVLEVYRACVTDDPHSQAAHPRATGLAQWQHRSDHVLSNEVFHVGVSGQSDDRVDNVQHTDQHSLNNMFNT